MKMKITLLVLLYSAMCINLDKTNLGANLRAYLQSLKNIPTRAPSGSGTAPQYDLPKTNTQNNTKQEPNPQAATPPTQPPSNNQSNSAQPASTPQASSHPASSTNQPNQQAIGNQPSTSQTQPNTSSSQPNTTQPTANQSQPNTSQPNAPAQPTPPTQPSNNSTPAQQPNSTSPQGNNSSQPNNKSDKLQKEAYKMPGMYNSYTDIARSQPYNKLLIDRYPTQVSLLMEGTLNIETKSSTIQTDFITKATEKSTNSKEHLCFYFRLSTAALYYTNSDKDFNILGFIQVPSIISVTRDITNSNCFTVVSGKDVTFNLCATTSQLRDSWVCAVKKAVKMEDTLCNPKPKPVLSSNNIKVKELFFLPKPARFCNEKWNYLNKGIDWECECKGDFQSPLVLEKRHAIKPSIKYPEFAYNKEDLNPASIQPSASDVSYSRMVFEDNMLKIKAPRLGMLYYLDGTIFKAKEIRFHTPGEHMINGKLPDLEVQIVHEGITMGDASRHAVLCIGFYKAPKEKNRFFSKLHLEDLPTRKKPLKELVSQVLIPDLFFAEEDKQESQMKKPSLFFYSGSLSSPPCQEETDVFVVKDLLPLDLVTIGMFRESLKELSKKGLFKQEIVENNRETQKLNDRAVFYLEGEDLSYSPDYHYEKMTVRKTSFVKVDGSEPSNVPGSFTAPIE